MPVDAENTCPFCGVEFEQGASACPSCDLPLLSADHIATANMGGKHSARVATLAVADRRPRPEYTIGDLRCVVVAMNLAEAEMLEDMLRSEGIPCVVRRAGSGANAYVGMAGQREILVPEGGLAAARDLLLIKSNAPREEVSTRLTIVAAAIGAIALLVLCIVVVLAFA
jgi:Putative prokaryotic signal transducing protein